MDIFWIAKYKNVPSPYYKPGQYVGLLGPTDNIGHARIFYCEQAAQSYTRNMTKIVDIVEMKAIPTSEISPTVRDEDIPTHEDIVLLVKYLQGKLVHGTVEEVEETLDFVERLTAAIKQNAM